MAAKLLHFSGGYPSAPVEPVALDPGPLPSPGRADEQSLRRQLLPVSAAAYQIGGIEVLRRDNAILRTMAASPDEREWRRMRRTEPRIGSSILGLCTLMMSYGWTIAPDPDRKGRRPAKLLADLGNAAVSAIEGLPAVLEAMALPAYDGWMPYQLLWSTQAVRFRGRAVWAVTNVLAQPQELFAFTPAWELASIYPTNWSSQPIEFSRPEDRLAWLVGRSGATNSPYGQPDLEVVWLAWAIKQKFLEWYQRSARANANGVPIFKDRTPPPAAPIAGELDAGAGREAMLEILAEAKQLLRIYDETGVIVCRGGLDLQMVENVAGMTGWREALDLLDLQIQVYLEGQHLTSQVRESGSRALGDTHQQTKIAYARRIALIVEETFNKLLRVLCEFNYAAVDPEDLPKLRMGLHQIVEVDKAQAAFNMGARLDGAAIAERWHIPLAELDADPATVWQKSAGAATSGAAPPTESGGAVGQLGREAAPEPVDTAEPGPGTGLG